MSNEMNLDENLDENIDNLTDDVEETEETEETEESISFALSERMTDASVTIMVLRGVTLAEGAAYLGAKLTRQNALIKTLTQLHGVDRDTAVLLDVPVYPESVSSLKFGEFAIVTPNSDTDLDLSPGEFVIVPIMNEEDTKRRQHAYLLCMSVDATELSVRTEPVVFAEASLVNAAMPVMHTGRPRHTIAGGKSGKELLREQFQNTLIQIAAAGVQMNWRNLAGAEHFSDEELNALIAKHVG